MNHILNIGLWSPVAEIAPTTALKALRAAGVRWDSVASFDQEYGLEEPTMVVTCEATDHQVHLVATWLEQDCIAVWDRMHREGRLVGPKPWGEFDSSKMVLPNGSRLSEARSVA